MKTKPWAIALVILFTFLMSAAQILYKIGAQRLAFNLTILTNWPLIIGIILYGISAILMIISFKGGEISVLYPILALTYVWVSLLIPHFIPGDTMNPTKWLGIILILSGVSSIGIGGGK